MWKKSETDCHLWSNLGTKVFWLQARRELGVAGDQEGGGGGAARLPHPGRHPPLQEQRGGLQG